MGEETGALCRDAHPAEAEITDNAATAIPNQCTGVVRGPAKKLDASTLRLRVKADEFCEITVRYNGDRSRVQVTSENCDPFHGPSCDFGGSLKRR